MWTKMVQQQRRGDDDDDDGRDDDDISMMMMKFDFELVARRSFPKVIFDMLKKDNDGKNDVDSKVGPRCFLLGCN